MKCRVCGKKLKLIASNKYLVQVMPESKLDMFSKINTYEAFDCTKCGCQNIMGIRETNVVGIETDVVCTAED